MFEIQTQNISQNKTRTTSGIYINYSYLTPTLENIRLLVNFKEFREKNSKKMLFSIQTKYWNMININCFLKSKKSREITLFGFISLLSNLSRIS
jgi:hypothetical protein